MDQLFSYITLADIHQDVMRNIVSLRESQNLYDDLSQKPKDWHLAQTVEDDVKPRDYKSRTPIIHRPFEDAAWWNAINWPFAYWQKSRFSDSSFGVWYGCDSVKTTVFESVFHWYRGLICDAGFDSETVISERKVYSVTCHAALLDLRQAAQRYPDLTHKTDYTYTQALGQRIHREGHPGLLTYSVRYQSGENFAIFNPLVLSNPRPHSYLTYRLEKKFIFVEKKAGTTWLKIPITEMYS